MYEAPVSPYSDQPAEVAAPVPSASNPPLASVLAAEADCGGRAVTSGGSRTLTVRPGRNFIVRGTRGRRGAGSAVESYDPDGPRRDRNAARGAFAVSSSVPGASSGTLVSPAVWRIAKR